MLKKLVITGLVLLVLSVSLPVIGYFYAKAHKEDFLKLATQKAKEQNLILSFQSEPNETPFYFAFRQFKLEGPNLPYTLNAEAVSLGPVLNASWPPLSVLLRVKKPIVTKNGNYNPTPVNAEPPSSTTLPSSVLFFSAWVLPLTQFKLTIESGEAPELGVHGANLSTALSSVRLNQNGISHALLDHDLIVKELALSTPLPLPGFRSKGRMFYEPPLVTVSDHVISFGPFNLQSSSKYSLESKKWSSDIHIPETHFKADGKTLNPSELPWLKSLNGQLSLKANIQGLGADPASINSDGTLIAKQMEVTIDHEQAKGKCLLDINTSFAKSENLNLDSTVNVDLTALELKKEDLFKKPVGVPLALKLSLSGKDRSYSIKQLEATFNNLKANLSGSITTGPQTVAALKMKVSPTALQGWENFFPKFSTVKTTGTLALDAAYSGPIQDWKSSAIDASLNAQDVRLPLLKGWLPSKDLNIEGLLHLDSNTHISYLKGVLRNLSTNTTINLKENQISYSNFFQKNSGIPLEAQLNIFSSATKAEIKKGSINLGQMKASLKGTIENFSAPRANLRLETGNLDATELLSFSPASKQKTVSHLHGKLLTKVNIKGPLTDPKELPQIQGITQLAKLSLDYLPENSKKSIQIKEISGNISFTNDSVSTKKLRLLFPQSDMSVDLELRSFSKPKMEFAITGNRFNSDDFTEPPPQGKGSAGASILAVGSAPVAISNANQNNSPNNGNEDFRSNPYLKTSQVKGSALFKEVTIAGTKAQQFAAKLSYDQLYLLLNPLSFKAFGGSIVSNTIWDGREKMPTTNQTIKIENVDANQFISSASESSKDLISGRLSSEMKFSLKGMSTQEIQKSLKGEGSFTLSDGKFKTIRFTQKPLESLKKIPFLSKAITKTDWDEKLNEATGRFKISDGKLSLSNLVLHSPYFDATTDETTLDLDQNLNSKLILVLKDSVIDSKSLEALKDSTGRPAIPLTLSGKVQSPTVGLDEGILEARAKAFVTKKAEEEAKRALSQAKNKAQEELEKKLKQGIGGLFK